MCGMSSCSATNIDGMTQEICGSKAEQTGDQCLFSRSTDCVVFQGVTPAALLLVLKWLIESEAKDHFVTTQASTFVAI